MPTPTTSPNPTEPPLPSSGPRVTSEPAGATRPLPEAARRALAEAVARRTERARADPQKSHAESEIGGRGGLDPTRYGDWEVNGLASDF